MEEFIIKTAQLILGLSLLIILHELGHFIPAKLFKTRVEKFFLFFDYKFALFKFRIGETVYGMGWIPLGGYVKIAGMIDESMDTDQMDKEPEPWEFRTKPAWQRLIIMLGGVFVNLILAMAIYAGILFTWGEKYIPNENLTGGVWVRDSLAYDLGLRSGDHILQINDQKIDRFTDILPNMILGGEMQVRHENGQQETMEIPQDFIGKLIDNPTKAVIFYRVPFIIGGIPDSSHNVNSGIQLKDLITGVNGVDLPWWDQYADHLKQFAGQEVTLNVMRDGEALEIPVKLNDAGQIGVMLYPPSTDDLERLGIYQFETQEYGFFESIPAGINKGVEQVGSYLSQLKMIFTPSTGAYKGVGGFKAIWDLYPPEWEWQVFWTMTAFLSVMLAVLNLLPIPALDGGHVMFTLWEIITGRKPGDKFMEYAQIFGLFIILALFLFANGNDIFRMFK
ncbi:RIP metalloprotease RseP [bacterium SCSIO 12741]|nr:RIP metalloprotease RseP [bacterium SCSIO 12741]